MTYRIEKPATNYVRLEFEIPAEEFEEAINAVYNEKRNEIEVTGFRKGKAPRRAIENQYGADVFIPDAVKMVIQEAYRNALLETGLRIVSPPEAEYAQAESGKPLLFAVTFAVEPEVKLGTYKGLEIQEDPVSVSEEEVEKEIRKALEKNAVKRCVRDRPVQIGDEISLNFKGFTDGVPFAGGEAENYPLVIGSGSFIPGFEDQLVGMNIGETKEIHVTFPENYTADLAGKPAVFVCKVNSISVKELPQLTDAFAKLAGGAPSLDAYRKDIRNRIRELRKKEARTKKKNELIDLAAENAEIDIPEPMIHEEQERLVKEFFDRLQSEGITPEQYLADTRESIDDLMEEVRGSAEHRIRMNLVLAKIAEEEQLEVSSEEIDAALHGIAKGTGIEYAELIKQLPEELVTSVREDLLKQKAIDLLYETSK